jgi:hypothetical protein
MPFFYFLIAGLFSSFMVGQTVHCIGKKYFDLASYSAGLAVAGLIATAYLMPK